MQQNISPKTFLILTLLALSASIIAGYLASSIRNNTTTTENINMRLPPSQ